MQPPLALTSTTQAQQRLAYDGSTYADLRTGSDGVLGLSAPMLGAHAVASGNQFAQAKIYWDEDETTRAGLLLRGTPDEIGWHHAKIVSDRDPALFSYGSYLGFYIEGKASGTDDDSVEEMRLIYARADEVKLILGGNITNGGTISFPFAPGGTYLGYQAGAGNPQTSTYNTLVGYQAGAALTGNNTTGGYNNTFVGLQVGATSTNGYGNTGVGLQALQSLTSGYQNTGLGIHALIAITSGYGNAAVGGGTMEFITTGKENVAVGMYAGRDVATGSNNVFLGFKAGMYETASNSFFVDNQDRTDVAGCRAKALLYGLFDADPAQQKFVVNAGFVFLPHIPTSSAGLPSGALYFNGNVLTKA